MGKKELMSWETCLKGHIAKIQTDENRAKELVKMSELRYDFWKKHCFDKKFVSLVVEGYYEIIKELLTALLYAKGFKSDNHECLIAFFKMGYPELDYEAQAVYQLKRVRNQISYRGFFVKPDYFEMNKLEFEHIIKTLKKLINDVLKPDLT